MAMKRFKVIMTRTYETQLHYRAHNERHAEDLCRSDEYRFSAELEQCNVISEEFKSEYSPEKPTIAAYWVLGFGMDCDGSDKCRVVPFPNQQDAEKYAKIQNEWSDGVTYGVTRSIDTLRDYCDGYMTDWTKFIVSEDTDF